MATYQPQDYTADELVRIGASTGKTPEEIAGALRRWQGAVSSWAADTTDADRWLKGNSKLAASVDDQVSRLAAVTLQNQTAKVIPDPKERLEFIARVNAKVTDGDEAVWTDEDDKRLKEINAAVETPAWQGRHQTAMHQINIGGANVGTVNLDIGKPGEPSFAFIGGKESRKVVKLNTPSKEELEDAAKQAEKEAASIEDHTLSISMNPEDFTPTKGLDAQAAALRQRAAIYRTANGPSAFLHDKLVSDIQSKDVADKELGLDRGAMAGVRAFIQAVPEGSAKAAVNMGGGLGDVAGIVIGDNALSKWRKEKVEALSATSSVNPLQADGPAAITGDAIGQAVPMVTAALATAGGATAVGATEATAATAANVTALGSMVTMGAASGADVADQYGVNQDTDPIKRRLYRLAGALTMPAIEGLGGTLQGKVASSLAGAGAQGVEGGFVQRAIKEGAVQGVKMMGIGGTTDIATNLIGPGASFEGDLPNPADPAARLRDFALGAIPGGLMGAAIDPHSAAKAKEAEAPAPRPQGRTAMDEGQMYYQSPEGEWSQVREPDPSGNMFVPLDLEDPDHASVIGRLNAKILAKEPKVEETPATAATGDETPVDNAGTVEVPPSVELPEAPNLPKQVEEPAPPIDENPVPTNETPPADGENVTPPAAGAEPVDEQPPATTTEATDSNEPTAAAPSQTEPTAAEVVEPGPRTSTKNAVTDAERQARGESPIEKQAARDWGTAWNDAVAAVEKDPTAGAKLVNELEQKPRALNDQDNALLLHEKVQKRKLVRDLVTQINDSPDGSRGDLQSRLAVALEELNRIDNATKGAGRETGRGLNARKMMRDEDNSLESMLATYRAAKGKDLTPEEVQKVGKLHQELDAAAKAVDGHSDAQSVKAGEEAMRRMQDELRQQMADKATAARERLKAREEQASAPKPLKYRDNLPDRADHVDWDTVDFLRAEGGLQRPPKLKVNDMGQVEKARGEHNALRQWAKDAPRDYGGLTGEHGLEIDVAAQHAFDDHLIDEPTPDALMAKLQDDIAARREGRRAAKEQERMMNEQERAATRESKRLEGEQRASMRAQQDAKVPVAEQAKTFFQEARNKARARLDADRGKLNADPLGFQFFRSTLDHTIIGASYLAEGALDFAKWSGHMISEFGDAIKPHLESIFDRSKSMFDQTRKDFAENAAAKERAATPRGVLESAVKQMSDGRMSAIDFDPKLAQDLAKAHIAAGVTDIHDLTAKVHADVIKFFPDLTPREVRDAFSEYGKVTKPSKDALKAQVREMKAQGRLVSAYEDALKGESPQKSGFQRGKPSEKVRELTTKVKDIMRKMGIETTGPEQLSNAREAIVNRLKNQIKDLHREMEGKAKPREAREKVQYDDEMNALKKERDELQEYMDDLTGPNAEAKWNKKAEAAAKASAENYRRRIAQNDLESSRGPAHQANEKTKAAIAEREAAKGEWERLRESAGIPQVEALAQLKQSLKKRINDITERIAGKAKPEAGKAIPLDTEARMLKFEHDRLNGILKDMEKSEKRGVTDAQRAEAATRATEKAIEAVEKELDTGKRPEKKSSSFVPDAKLRALKAELESLRGIRDAAREAKIVRRTPEEIALDSLKKRLKTATEKLDERLQKGDFSKPQPKKVTLDTEAINLKAAYENKKLEFDREVEKHRLARRSRSRKIMDAIVRWRRGFLLSGYHTLTKLTGAALWRLALTPAEEAIGGVLSHLPIIRRVAEAAPREGGMSLRAEARALTDGVVGAIKEFGTMLKTGKSSLDAHSGTRDFHDLDPSIIDFFGHVHAALKSPAKMGEFHRSFQKRAEFAMRNRLDPHDPVIQAQMMKGAYLDANKAIFMQENFVTKGFNLMLDYFDRNKTNTTAGPGIAAVARMLLPIVKVPSNIVREVAGSYIGGLPRGAFELAGLMRRGFKDMSPEEADAVMRHLKKGSLGAGLLLWGFFNSKSVGGYYQQGEKRKDDDVHFGDVKIAGKTISHQLLHTPALDAIQFGATMKRVADTMIKEHGRSTGQTKGMTEGAKAAALGLLDTVPFAQNPFGPFQAGHEGEYKRQKLVESVVPQLVKNIAEDTDPLKRQTKGLGDAIKSVIPGLRETLPPAKANKSHH